MIQGKFSLSQCVLKWILACAVVVVIAGCNEEGPDQPITQSSTSAQIESADYDTDSWKTIIPDTCSRFFDGCNQCRRVPGNIDVACTRMSCPRYSKPECLDNSVPEQNAETTTDTPETREYFCDKHNRFSVFFGKYVVGDREETLAEGEVVFADRQTLAATRLQRMDTTSGNVFTDGRLVFQLQGDEAQVLLQNEPLYVDCKTGT